MCHRGRVQQRRRRLHSTTLILVQFAHRCTSPQPNPTTQQQLTRAGSPCPARALAYYGTRSLGHCAHRKTAIVASSKEGGGSSKIEKCYSPPLQKCSWAAKNGRSEKSLLLVLVHYQNSRNATAFIHFRFVLPPPPRTWRALPLAKRRGITSAYSGTTTSEFSVEFLRSRVENNFKAVLSRCTR